MASDANGIDDLSEFERGRRLGRQEGFAEAIQDWQRRDRPFQGLPDVFPITRGARYEFIRSYFDSYVAYERNVTDVLRDVQRERWQVSCELVAAQERMSDVNDELVQIQHALSELSRPRRWWINRTRPWSGEVDSAHGRASAANRRADALLAFQRDVLAELRRVRSAVDAELQQGNGVNCIVEAMRCAPVRPDGVREYASVSDFVEEDPRRALIWPDRTEAGGWAYGGRWSLEDPLRRWESTRWHVCWLAEPPATFEAYGVERLDGGRDSGRVWLLGTITERDRLEEALSDLEHHAQPERNSFAAVARSVVRAARKGP